MMWLKCDERQKLEMATFSGSQVKGMNEYQTYYLVTLLVTVEQEKAIVDLFKQRNWMYVKTVQGQTLDDLQRLCERTSAVTPQLHSPDEVLEPHIGTDAKQEYNKHGISGDTCGRSDLHMQPENLNKVSQTSDNNNIRIKEENNIEHNESSITEGLTNESSIIEGLTEGVVQKPITFSASAALCALSKIATDISGMKASSVEDKGCKDSEYSILRSSLTKPIMAAQNTVHPPHTAKSNHDITGLATAGNASSETSKSGIRCEFCEKFFQNKIEMEIHSTFGKCKWVCKICKKAFVYNKANHKGVSFKRFQKALEQHKKECDCICKLCGYSSDERANLMRHMKSRHSISNAKQFACDICFFTFKSKTFLYAHKINKHTGEGGIYSCPVCPKQYPMLHSLKEHYRYSHLDQKRDKKPCNVCGKILDIYALKVHEYTHKTKDVQCDKCPAVFKTENHLKAHQRRHNKDYRYFCESCGKGCYTLTNLVNHRRIHTGEKPFSCSVCQYSCNVKVNLDKHMKIHEKRSSNGQK